MAAARTRRAARRPVAIRPGATLGRYRIGRLLHEGGMARLYAVESRTPLILKVPKLGPGHPASSLVAFENELRILERLRGPHVPKLVASGDLTTQPYLILERLDGDELAQAAQRAPLPVDELCRLGRRLARAVQALHHQNVIHLDLNPSNVRNRADGTMVLIDFGLAHHAALPDLHDAAFGEAEGTTAYIAPEQLHHVRNDSRSDIYALGAILYQLATGRFAFGRPNLLSLQRRLAQPPWPPRVHRPDLPPWLQEIILRCLETRPEQRYTTAKRVAHQLTHPETVPDTHRAHRRTRPGLVPRTRAWARSIFQKFDADNAPRPYDRLATSPHVLVALNLAHCSEPQKETLRRAVRRLAASEPRAYFTCLSVVPAEEAERAREQGRPAPDLARQVLMRNWAQSLRLPEARLVFQVLPGAPVRTLLGYARRHLVDHIIIGARGSSALRRHLGSVSAAVAAQAECTVTVVRTRKDAGKTRSR
jgi:serine/threonine protein kinase